MIGFHLLEFYLYLLWHVRAGVDWNGFSVSTVSIDDGEDVTVSACGYWVDRTHGITRQYFPRARGWVDGLGMGFQLCFSGLKI